MARRLRDLRIHEISLVDMPANMRRFVVVKRQTESEMDELIKLIEAFTGQKLDDETVSKAEIKEELKKALQEKLQLLDKYRSDLPADVVLAIGALSRQAVFGVMKSDDKKDDEETDKGKQGVTVEELADSLLEKAGAKFSKDTKEILGAVVSKIDDLNKAVQGLKDLMAKGGDNKGDDDEINPEELQKMIDARVAVLKGED